METFLNRYRNLTVLLLLLVGQLILLAWQVKSNQEGRLIRVWAVTAVTPLARGFEWARGSGSNFLSGYLFLQETQQQNQALQRELGRTRLENHFLKDQIAAADRLKVLQTYQAASPSKLLPARVIGTGTGLNSQTVYVDKGSADGVQKGMAVIRPEGIVGKVVAAYPTASLIMLVTEQGFAAGAITQKNRIRGTLKGTASNLCRVDYVPNEKTVDVGEWVYTTGDDRIFPRGLPIGIVKTAKETRSGKEIWVSANGLQGGLEELLIVLDGVHAEVPEAGTTASAGTAIKVLPPPPKDPNTVETPAPSGAATEADRLVQKYRRVGEAQGIVLGTTPGRAPDFNKPVPANPPAAAPAKPDAAPTNPPPASVKQVP